MITIDPTNQARRATCRKSYRQGEHDIEAVRNISYRRTDGEFVSMVGASGCGKTTFLRMVDGLITPTAGRSCIDGKPVDQPGRRPLRLPARRLLPWRNVLHNVASVPRSRRNRRDAIERRRAEHYSSWSG